MAIRAIAFISRIREGWSCQTTLVAPSPAGPGLQLMLPSGALRGGSGGTVQHWVATMQLGQHSATCFPPNLGTKPPYSHFEATKSVVCFFAGVFPWEQSRWARTRGSAEAAYRLTPSRLQPGAAAAISAVNLITNKGGVEAKLSSC